MPCTPCQISEDKKYLFFNVLVRYSFASILSLVHMHIVTKRKDGLAFSFVVLNLQISIKLGLLLFYKTNSLKIVGKLRINEEKVGAEVIS